MPLQNRIKLSPPVVYFLIIASPIFAYFLASLQRLHSGSIFKFIESRYVFEVPNILSPIPFNIFAVVFSIQLIFVWILPSDDYKVVTSTGEKCIINANSFISSVLIALLYIFGASIGIYNGSIFYDHFLTICALMSVYCICINLYLHYWYNPNESTSKLRVIETSC